MKLSMNMLKQYTRIDVTPAEYESRMVMSGTAVEGVEDMGAELENVVVGRVLSVAPVEGSDHLHVCMVDVGEDAPLQIVCGAPNVAEGALVPVAKAGARLPGGVHIKKGKMRGVESCGMLCASTELKVPQDLYPSIGDAGLLIFNEDYAPGTDVRTIFGLNDTAVDFEILANRPDCLSAVGIARETAAVLGGGFAEPDRAFKTAGGDINAEVSVRVDAPDLCPRYAARVIANVRVAPSPMWMRQYLHAAGLRSINNIVDITNYVMLEYGHPMHAFDLDQVRGRQIIVRRAKDGEKLSTLDEVERTLTPADLVICDRDGATGLAGVMGGLESEITDRTKTVMFECASFDRTAIRLTARAQGVRTESSGRFERGVYAATVMDALDRACHLVDELNAGDVLNGVVDLYPAPPQQQVITASVKRIAHRAGVDIPAADMKRILESLHFGVRLDGDMLTVTVPAFRGDLDGEADLCEEVLRLYGYEHIGATALRGETTQGGLSPMLRIKNRMAELLCGMGGLEIMNFSFINPKQMDKLMLPAADARRQPLCIRNPLGEDTSVMRPTMAPGMLTTLAFNMSHGVENARLYEMGATFDPTHPTEEGLPTETQTLCIGVYGEQEDFYTLRGMCEALLRAEGIACDIVSGAETYHHPGRCATLIAAGQPICKLGEVHPDVRAAYDLPKRALIAELNLSSVIELGTPMGEVKPLPRFPSVSRDLALVMSDGVAVGPLMQAMKKAAGSLLESIHMFDVYRGLQVGPGRKSVAFSLVFRAPDRTLEEADVQKAMDKVQKACAEQAGAAIRG